MPAQVPKSVVALAFASRQPSPVPIDIDSIFARGGKKLIDLLDYGVRSVQPDVLFVFLVQEYRQLPTTPKAVALHEIFCAPRAAARVSASEMLHPFSLQIEVAMRPLISNLARVEEARAKAAAVPPLILPAKYLFDTLDLHLRKKSASLRGIKRHYRVRLSPVKNLPGGRMNASQRHFVDKVWEPILLQ